MPVVVELGCFVYVFCKADVERQVNFMPTTTPKLFLVLLK
jgi:hypothetical protein